MIIINISICDSSQLKSEEIELYGTAIITHKHTKHNNSV